VGLTKEEGTSRDQNYLPTSQVTGSIREINRLVLHKKVGKDEGTRKGDNSTVFNVPAKCDSRKHNEVRRETTSGGELSPSLETSNE